MKGHIYSATPANIFLCKVPVVLGDIFLIKIERLFYMTGKCLKRPSVVIWISRKTEAKADQCGHTQVQTCHYVTLQKKGLSSSFISLMSNKTYCIAQYSHLELVCFKIQNLNAFLYCLLFSTLTFQCFLKGTVASETTTKNSYLLTK